MTAEYSTIKKNPSGREETQRHSSGPRKLLVGAERADSTARASWTRGKPSGSLLGTRSLLSFQLGKISLCEARLGFSSTWARGQAQQTTTCIGQANASCRHPTLAASAQGFPARCPFPCSPRWEGHAATTWQSGLGALWLLAFAFFLSLASPVLTKPLLLPSIGTISQNLECLIFNSTARGQAEISHFTGPGRTWSPQKRRRTEGRDEVSSPFTRLVKPSSALSFLPACNPSGIRRGGMPARGSGCMTRSLQVSLAGAG